MQQCAGIAARSGPALSGRNIDDRAAEDQRRPQHHDAPRCGGEKLISTHGGEPDDDHPEKEDDEDRRAVAGILGREVEPANLAGSAGHSAGP